MSAIVTILTDFGDLDPYVGVMKGVIASIAPRAAQFDLTHKIPPGDIQSAAYALLQTVPYYPPGTIHLVVVDPGVGSRRRPMAAQVGPATVVGPDNGVFTYLYAVYGIERAVELTNPRFRLSPVSNTFHGRDIFSPAAAHLARGVALAALGSPLDDPVRIEMPRMTQTAPNQIIGQLLHADHFGNLASSIAWLNWQSDGTVDFEPWLPDGPKPCRFDASKARITVTGAGGAPQHTFTRIVRTFSDVGRGEAAVIIGSERHLDLVVNRGSAAEQLGVGPGGAIVLDIPAE